MMSDEAKNAMFKNVSEDFKERYQLQLPPTTWLGWRWWDIKVAISKVMINTGIKVEPSGVMRNFMNEGSSKFLAIVLAEIIQQRILSGNMEGVNVAEAKCMCGQCNQKPQEQSIN